MPLTDFFKISYPSEDLDPWYEEFENYVKEIDKQNFGILSSAGSVLIPPSTINFNPSIGRLSWNDDFVMPILGSSKFLRIKYGPDGVNRWIDLNDGDKIIVVVPLTSAEDISANFKKVSGKVSAQSGLFIAGIRYGFDVYMNIGIKI